MSNLKVYSEIGRLNKVLVHKPGQELLHLTPEWLSDLLFDDIPWLKKAREEHEIFQNKLQEQGVEVIELIDAVSLCLENDNVRLEFIDAFLNESNIDDVLMRKKYRYF